MSRWTKKGNFKPRFEDLTGRRFHKLVVVKKSSRSFPKNVFWECQCDCGNIHITRSFSLKAEAVRSCGCIRARQCNAGERYGRLEVLRRLKNMNILCKCECGNIKEIAATSLFTGRTKSCGCLAVERRIAASKTHGLSGTFEHRVWKGIITRCLNPNARTFKYYGGAGVSICPEWRKSFVEFLKYVGKCPPDKTSLDRINPFGNYEPGNVRWSDDHEQALNRRKSWIKRREGLKDK